MVLESEYFEGGGGREGTTRNEGGNLPGGLEGKEGAVVGNWLSPAPLRAASLRQSFLPQDQTRYFLRCWDRTRGTPALRGGVIGVNVCGGRWAKLYIQLETARRILSQCY